MKGEWHPKRPEAYSNWAGLTGERFIGSCQPASLREVSPVKGIGNKTYELDRAKRCSSEKGIGNKTYEVKALAIRPTN